MTSKVETIIGVIWGFFVRLALLAGLVYALYQARSILVAVLLAVMLTYVVLPLVNSLSAVRVRGWSYKSRRFWACVLVFVVLLALTGVAVQYIVAPFVHEASDLIQTVRKAESFESLSKQFSGWFNRLPDDIRDLFGEKEKDQAWDALKKWLLRVVGSTVAWGKNILDIILIPVLAFYFALDYRSLRREFVGALPKRRRKEALYLLRHVGGILQNYIIGQLILCLIAGAVIGLVLWGLEMDYVLALAVFAGVTRAIPIIGPIISGIAIVVLGLFRSSQLGMFLLGVFSLLQFVESKFILPKLIGDRMRLHPAVIIIVLLIGSEFFGIIGMFVAAPVAAILRELIRFYIIAPRNRREETDPQDEAIDLPSPHVRSHPM
ncbi:MAG: AI-2E family transporter [Armatimonadota bacterium]|nr:AI-2E family transporter [Armatimonadota bacterium]